MAALQTEYKKAKNQKQNASEQAVRHTGEAIKNESVRQLGENAGAGMGAAADWRAGSSAAGGLYGLSDATMAGLAQYGQQYAPSQSVLDAQDYLKSVMDSGPGSFQSRYTGQIASLYNQIMNRPAFVYDVNKDPLFQQYKDQYTVQGQRAMQDVMGQAAALTGGYGNSWGSTAGYQAYQYYLQLLNDRIPELEQRAFDKYKYEGEELRRNMDMTNQLDSIDYGRYRDTVADWQASVNAAASAYSTAANSDMAMWQNMQDYYKSLAAMENSNYWNEQDMAYQRDKAAMDDAYRRDQLAQSQSQYEADLAFRQAQLAQSQRQWEAEQALAQAKFNLQLRQYEDALAKTLGGGGSGGGSNGNTEARSSAPAQEALVYPVLPANAAAIAKNPISASVLSPTATRGITQTEWDTMQRAMANTYNNSIQKANQEQAALQALAKANGASGLTALMVNAAKNKAVISDAAGLNKKKQSGKNK